MVVDHRLLSDGIGGDPDPMMDAAGLDLDEPSLAVEGEAHGDDRLQCVALGASGRPGIGGAAGDSRAEIEDTGDGLGRDARPEVADLDQPLGNGDLDPWRLALFLRVVDRVVDQLLDRDERPLLGRMADLARELTLAEEIEQPRGGERLGREHAPGGVTHGRGSCCNGLCTR